MANNGKQGERLFKEIMDARGYKVQDVSDNPDYWPLDIDFIITSPTTGQQRTFEVKWDTRINRTENLFLEIRNPRSKQWNGEGWWKHCQADYLVYGDAVSHSFHIFPMKELRERVDTLNLYTKTTSDGSVGMILSLRAISDIEEDSL